MGHQDPEVWRLLTWVTANQAWIYGGVLSFIVSLIKTFIDHEKLSFRDAADAMLCMLFVAVSKPLVGLSPMDIGDNWALPYGLMIGFAGAAYIKPFILNFLTAYRNTTRGDDR